VLGPSAEVQQLAAVLYAPDELIAATAESAARTGMVTVAGPVVTFSHDLYREAAYSALDEPARRSTHRRAAQVTTGAASVEHLRRAGRGADVAVADALAQAARHEAAYAPAVSAELLADAEPFLAPGDERREGCCWTGPSRCTCRARAGRRRTWPPSGCRRSRTHAWRAAW